MEGNSEEQQVQDQVLINAEATSHIFTFLDFQSLKRCRLVCKSWQNHSAFHLKQRVTVPLIGPHKRIVQFLQEYSTEKASLSPMIEEVEIDLTDVSGFEVIHTVKKLSNLPQTLVVTKLNTGMLTATLALPLILKWSKSLVHLHVKHSRWGEALEDLSLDKGLFPRLKSLFCECLARERTDPGYAALVIWIINSAVALEDLEVFSHYTGELCSKILGQVSFEKFKSLKLLNLKEIPLNTFTRLQSLQYNSLQTLDLSIKTEDEELDTPDLLLKIVSKSGGTLKKLTLQGEYEDYLHVIEDFPVCPNVQQLGVYSFPFGSDFIARKFPSLQQLVLYRLSELEIKADTFRSEFQPLPGVKTLKVKAIHHGYSGDSLTEAASLQKLLNKLPDLRRLKISNFFLQCCFENSADEDQEASFPSIEDLIVTTKSGQFSTSTSSKNLSCIRRFGGLRSITLKERSTGLLSIPFEQLPHLESIQFEWTDGMDASKVAEKIQGLRKIALSNCCSYPGLAKRPPFRDEFYKFMDLIPGVICGCRESRRRWQK